MAAKDDYLLENLIDLGYVNYGQVEALRAEAEAAGSGVVDLMLDKKVISSAILTQAKAAHFGFEVATLSEIRLDDELISSVPRNVAKRYRVVPVYRHGNHLAIALSDPSDLNTIDSLQHILRAELDVKVASEDEIDAALKKYYGADDSDLGKMIQDITEGEVEVSGVGGGGEDSGETVDGFHGIHLQLRVWGTGAAARRRRSARARGAGAAAGDRRGAQEACPDAGGWDRDVQLVCCAVLRAVERVRGVTGSGVEVAEATERTVGAEEFGEVVAGEGCERRVVR